MGTGRASGPLQHSVTLHSSSENVQFSEVMAEVAAIKKSQEAVVSQMNVLRAENQHVWKAYRELQEKLNKQQNIINKVTRTSLLLSCECALICIIYCYLSIESDRFLAHS